ncbi:unnamed protein product [Fusarium equiseti]|uniref:Uncharacterized protein n=1 Tax=Fusarium equiseti TaxID=61235 RepID=A0A8J2NPU9_FUSEQ|nr:unnamed protein product [Fusarium equiseti]
MRKREAEIAAERVPELPMDLADLSSVQSPDDLDLLCLQFELESEPLPGEDVAEKLMESFRTSGYQTLTDRAGQSQNTVFTSCILPLSDSCMALKQACIAYQASLSSATNHYTPLYMESALSNYLSDLDNPDRLSQDVTLATGVLLCSVSINSLYIWTPLLKGLHGVLQTRELLNDTHKPRLTNHLVEVIALMDIPFFTLNRITPSLNMWKLYIQANKTEGIEETSGLPYTLITLLANLDSPDAESDLLSWPGELGDDFIHIHLWEAFKYAGVLHSRVLNADSIPSRVKTEVLRMKVFAAIQAIISTGGFNFHETLAKAILYPLFIAGLLAENEQDQRLTRVGFQYLLRSGDEKVEQMLLAIVTKVWKKGKDGDAASRLMMATETAAELNVEIHLY